MKRLIIGLLAITFAVGLFTPQFLFAQTDDKIEYVLFHLEACHHCQDEIEFIEKEIMPEYGEYIDLQIYEVSEPANQDLFRQYTFYHQTQAGAVPIAFIADEVVAGFGSVDTTGKQIRGIIEKELRARGLLAKTSGGEECQDEQECLQVPVLGKIDAKTFSLPILTVVIGLLDGFNPCAMWVLLFLISLLLGIEDRKRMWLLGTIFIISSGIVYFIFMAAWLQLLLFLGMITIIRIIIGLVAVGVGGFNLRDYWQTRKSDGVVCKVSKDEKAKKTFGKIKDIVYRQSLWWSILGIILLGFSVNLVELACSAGFPAIFTQVLAINDLPTWQRYLYMAGYILFYMLDDMIVFVLAMITLKSKVLGTKYAKYSNLIGGLLILILGLLLIFKPEWLMFI